MSLGAHALARTMSPKMLMSTAFTATAGAPCTRGVRGEAITPTGAAILKRKARPGTKVSVLVTRERLDDVLAALFRRVHHHWRAAARGGQTHAAERRVATSFGEVRVKVATLPDGRRRWKCEHEDIAARAGADFLATKADIDRQVEQALA